MGRWPTFLLVPFAGNSHAKAQKSTNWKEGIAMKVAASPVEERLADSFDPVVQDMGYDLVRIKVSGSTRKTLQLMAERKDLAPMTVEDCEAISRALSLQLDVEDPISGAYNLEVSSPGIDRPLSRIGDFERFKGHEAKVEATRSIDGRKRFRGELQGVKDDHIVITVDGEDLSIHQDDVAKAKLVLTDALIEAVSQGKVK